VLFLAGRVAAARRLKVLFSNTTGYETSAFVNPQPDRGSALLRAYP